MNNDNCCRGFTNVSKIWMCLMAKLMIYACIHVYILYISSTLIMNTGISCKSRENILPVLPKRNADNIRINICTMKFVILVVLV